MSPSLCPNERWTRQTTTNRSLDTSCSSDAFVLVSVLWIVGIIAAATMALVLTVQVQIRTAANARQGAMLEETANGLARLTAFGLADRLAGPEAHLFAASGVAYRCEPHGGSSALIAIQDQAGLVDLNAASPDLLKLLLSAVAPDRTQAVGAILDFRDADDETSPGGAEADGYRQAGKDYGPKNGPFQATAELDQVLGLEGEAASKLLPYVTVHGFQNGIDPAVAPPHLAKLLQEPGGVPQTQSQRQFFAIDVIVSADNGGRFHRKAMVAVTREPETPYRLVEWLQGPGQLEGETKAQRANGPGCLLSGTN